MEKDFKRSFIVGKFCPLHKGHELLIQNALRRSNELVIFSYTKQQYAGCETQTRRQWLTELFPTARVYVFDDHTIKEWGAATIPEDSDTDEVHRLFTANLYVRVIGKPLDAIFTSESYGPGFTSRMSEVLHSHGIQSNPVQHVSVDLDRKQIPISGSKVRLDPLAMRSYLSAIVYQTFLKRVLFLGPESSGKSTLAEYCAQRYQTVFLDEYGRTRYEEKKGHLEFDDMLHIAQVHVARLDIQAKNANRFLFVDTSPLTTLCYSYLLFNKADRELQQLADNLNYNHIFYCAPDFPMVQDGTRVDETFRKQQHEWYLKTLAERNVSYAVLHGDLDQRTSQIHQVLFS